MCGQSPDHAGLGAPRRPPAPNQETLARFSVCAWSRGPLGAASFQGSSGGGSCGAAALRDRIQIRASFRALSTRRHFAAKALRFDLVGTTIGSLVYLGLVPVLRQTGRPDLAAAAVLCAALCHWPLALNRLGHRNVYLRARDHILVMQ